MTRTVRWGVLSASNFAQKDWIPALQQSSHGHLVALATSSPEKAARATAMEPSLKIVPDYDALLQRDDVDAIYIPLPNHMHVEWAKKALEAGKHVLAEKPLAMHASEIDDLIALRDKTGLHMAEAFMVTHHPQWTRVREIIKGGGIGRLRHIDAAFSFTNRDMGNIRNRSDAGGGALRDIGVYPTCTSRFVMQQEPEVLSARVEWEAGVDVVVRAQLQFPDDVGFDFYISTRMHRRQEMAFHGEDGLIRIGSPFNAGLYRAHTIEWQRDGHGDIVEHFEGTQQYVNQLNAFHDTVLNGADYACPLEFSLGNQQVIDALFEKAGTPD
ncbi:Gfo/Idh/MocA family oxidoreductase [Parvularcula sp. LCG005]|uniref:Gfo/Idh/MocA family protein n=1 Tax=Parvularcula sp. LCG005 TaxID=3078805 RepID=UPI002941F9E4|nr:Gfo/Idh/MocA family oxidoreductase [Parvularcula sp. LCG005]WOI53256.1 Gfo/Idh/MocA family oxidoreductase [Parvularcula sp. LCG005]